MSHRDRAGAVLLTVAVVLFVVPGFVLCFFLDAVFSERRRRK